jgi:predicted NodU family carbamoyl transferase
MLLTFAAHQAREASVRDRSQAESGLSGALGILIETSADISGEIEKDLIRELRELTEKIKMAITMHVDAVTRTQSVRKKWVNRFFRLAGTAPEPVTYEFEGDVL